MHKFLLSTAFAAAVCGSAAAQTPAVTAQPPSVAPGAGDISGGMPTNDLAPPAVSSAPLAPMPGPAVPGRAINPGAIKDSTTLSTGQAAVDSSAIVADTHGSPGMGLAGGMAIKDMGGMTLGHVLSVTKDSSGRAGRVIIQTTDGVRRAVDGSNLTAKQGFAVTTQSEADLVAMPALK